MVCRQNGEIRVANFWKGLKMQGQDFALKLDLAGHAPSGTGGEEAPCEVPAGAKRHRNSHLILLPTQQRSLLPSGSPAGAKGHPSPLIYTPHFIALHPICCSCTSPGYLRGPFFALALDQPFVFSEPFSFLPPRSCRLTASLTPGLHFLT